MEAGIRAHDTKHGPAPARAHAKGLYAGTDLCERDPKVGHDHLLQTNLT
jgi:hypothetical protein